MSCCFTCCFLLQINSSWLLPGRTKESRHFGGLLDLCFLFLWLLHLREDGLIRVGKGNKSNPTSRPLEESGVAGRQRTSNQDHQENDWLGRSSLTEAASHNNRHNPSTSPHIYQNICFLYLNGLCCLSDRLCLIRFYCRRVPRSASASRKFFPVSSREHYEMQ